MLSTSGHQASGLWHFFKKCLFCQNNEEGGCKLVDDQWPPSQWALHKFEKQHFSIRKFRYATLQLILRKNSLILCTHDNNRGESRISQVLCSLHSKETQMEKSSYHHYLKRLQPLIVHPGFGDLQKWILQVKYSL